MYTTHKGPTLAAEFIDRLATPKHTVLNNIVGQQIASASLFFVVVLFPSDFAASNPLFHS